MNKYVQNAITDKGGGGGSKRYKTSDPRKGWEEYRMKLRECGNV